MTLAPLSAIAGMDFPGEPSLYLGHEIRASRPVHYGDRLTYSAKIVALNRSHRVLTLRVLVLRAAEVVLDATMRVQARDAAWASAPAHEIRSATNGVALVTGASGEIGQAVAVALARRGWRLLLQDRGPSKRRTALEEALTAERAGFDFITADLSGEAGRETLAAAVAAEERIGLVVHAASAPVPSAAEAHVPVAYSALKAVADAAIPHMLARQAGVFVLIGSSAVEAAIPGWEAYAGAKMMTTQLLRGIDIGYAGFGITGHTLAPGLVATDFSAAFRDEEMAALMPSEVADHLLALIDDRLAPDRDMIVDTRGARRGRFGFGTSAAPATAAAPVQAAVSAAPVAQAAQADGALDAVIRKALGLSPDFPLTGAGLGVTPGWDSLRHIELLLLVEETLGTHFTAGEIDATHRYDELVRLVAHKQGATA
jgi:short-subunit dehydrogenase